MSLLNDRSRARNWNCEVGGKKILLLPHSRGAIFVCIHKSTVILVRERSKALLGLGQDEKSGQSAGDVDLSFFYKAVAFQLL